MKGESSGVLHTLTMKRAVISTERRNRVKIAEKRIFPALHFVSYGDTHKITPAVFSVGQNEQTLVFVQRKVPKGQ